MSALDALIDNLGPEEEITLKVRREGDDVRVVMVPRLDHSTEEGPGGNDEAERVLRQVLAQPAKWTLTPQAGQSVAAMLDEQLRAHATPRTEALDAHARYCRSVREAVKSAQQASTSSSDKGAKKKTSSAKASSKASSATSEPVATAAEGEAESATDNSKAGNENPDSLL